MTRPIKKELFTGIDDATKCPCIGSIFVAGVVANAKTIKKWKQLGVKDSKLIAPKKREKLAAIIKETAQAFTIEHMPPKMIDNKVVNLNAWEMITMLKIIQNLHHSTELQSIYVDNWEVSKKVFKERLHQLITQKDFLRQNNITLETKKLLSLWLIPEHRADENYTIVGAASILAKVASDAQYVQYKKKYGDFGSGSPGDPRTRLFVWKHRKKPLPIIRTSWKTYKTLAPLDNIEDDPLYKKRNNAT